MAIGLKSLASQISTSLDRVKRLNLKQDDMGHNAFVEQVSKPQGMDMQKVVQSIQSWAGIRGALAKMFEGVVEVLG